MRELPVLVALRERMKSRGVEVLGVSLDEMSRESLQAFVNRHGVTYPVLLAGEDRAAIKEFFGYGGGLPETHIFNWNGVKRKTLSGSRSERKIEEEINRVWLEPSGGAEEAPETPWEEKKTGDGAAPPAESGNSQPTPLLKAMVMGRKGDVTSEALLAEVKKSGIRTDRIFFFDTTSEADVAHLRELGYEPLDKPGVMICTDQICAPPAYTPEEVRDAIKQMSEPD